MQIVFPQEHFCVNNTQFYVHVPSKTCRMGRGGQMMIVAWGCYYFSKADTNDKLQNLMPGILEMPVPGKVGRWDEHRRMLTAG